VSQTVLIVGLGEVGKPLFEIVKTQHEVFGVDIDLPAPVNRCDIMHICFPFRDQKFVAEVVKYVGRYKPALTIVNSTVAPGTSRRIADESSMAVVNSPVRGKHARMREEMLHYTKFIGALDPESGARAAQHFESVGIKSKVLGSPETTEIAKLTETTYFGVLIAWAQEVERYCKGVGAGYDEVVSFYEEIKFFPPVKYFPGAIGGHCVMPNIDILRQKFPSGLLQAVVESNRLKEKSLGQEEWQNWKPGTMAASLNKDI
jgi:UDP-N-acetyl-D-mannosaminuronate dehydrogenase